MKDIDLKAERAAFESWFKEKSPVCGINAKLAARDAWLARAAVEADMAQRVPDGWANLLKAAREVLSWTQAADRPPVRDKYECGRMTGVRVHALADLHEAVQVLASTPAPAQQEPVEGCDPHWSYYFKVTECKAKTSRDGDCICWHTEGTGPFDMVRHDDADQFLEWRESPSSAPAPAQQEASGYGPRLMPQVSGYGPQVETTVAHVAHQCPAFCTYPACQSTGKTCLGACAKQAAQHQEPLQQEPAPIDMVLHCPACGMQHIDDIESTLEWTGGSAPEPSHKVITWDNPPHRSHLCHCCGHIWRPADVPTNGVQAVKTKGKADSPEPPQQERRPMTPAASDVLAERQRQISAEGWTPEHDDEHEAGEMAEAAGCYALADEVVFYETPPSCWPWAAEWWKPGDKRRNLVKAGALILAEIERLDRAAERHHGIRKD